MPERPGVSSAAPARYQTICTTTGARWSSMTTTSIPLGSVVWDALAFDEAASAEVAVNAVMEGVPGKSDNRKTLDKAATVNLERGRNGLIVGVTSLGEKDRVGSMITLSLS